MTVDAPDSVGALAAAGEKNTAALRRLLNHLEFSDGFSLALAWIPNEATARALVNALREALAEPPIVLDARRWHGEPAFPIWLLQNTRDKSLPRGAKVLLTGLAGVDPNLHALGQINVHRNRWMQQAPYAWIFVLPPYDQLRAVAREAGIEDFTLGDEMSDLYSVRSGDFHFTEVPSTRTDERDWDPRLQMGLGIPATKFASQLAYIADLRQGISPAAEALYARALIDTFEAELEAAAPDQLREIEERLLPVRKEWLSEALGAHFIALHAKLCWFRGERSTARALAPQVVNSIDRLIYAEKITLREIEECVAGLIQLEWWLEAPPPDPDRLEATARHLLQLLTHRFQLRNSVVAALHHFLSRLLLVVGRINDAESPLRETLAIRESVLGREHPETATAVNDLASMLRRQGHAEEAESLYRRAHAIRDEVLGPNHPQTAASLNNLALFLTEQGRANQAIPLYGRALDIYENAYGPEHYSLAYVLNNLALALEDVGNLEDAERAHRRSLQIRLKVSGSNHPVTAKSLGNLSMLLRRQHRDAEAEDLQVRALQIHEQQSGENHPDTARALHNLATLLAEQGRFERAIPLQERALAASEISLGSDHPFTRLASKQLRALQAAGCKVASDHPGAIVVSR